MKTSSIVYELNKVFEKLKIESLNELGELVDIIYDGDAKKFFENYDKIEILEFTNLYDYGEELIKNLNICIPEQIKDYVRYDIYAENYIEENDMTYTKFKDRIYIYPAV